MELKEALSNLDQVCAAFKGTRLDHMTLQQSLQVVRSATVQVSPKEEQDGEEKEPDGNTK